MSLSLTLSQKPSLSLQLVHSHRVGYRRFEKTALKAFKKIIVGGTPYYTCNVARLRECNRLGTEKEIALWFTHFFMCSPYFDDVFAAIFSTGPGEELTNFTRAGQIRVFVAMNEWEFLDPADGVSIRSECPLLFASVPETNVPTEIQ